jgi:hypothetical protein
MKTKVPERMFCVTILILSCLHCNWYERKKARVVGSVVVIMKCVKTMLFEVAVICQRISCPTGTGYKLNLLRERTLCTWKFSNFYLAFGMYKGESKIIRNVDTCAVGYTAGWAWCDMCGLLFSYCCGTDVTLIVDLCHEFCVINLDGPLFICTKEEQRAVIRFLWAEGLPGAEMHRRISVQYGNSVVSQQMVYEWIERFKNGRIRCDTTLFPYCTDILLCILAPGTPSAHKKRITALCSSLVQMKSGPSKFMT